jgi:hypothetical protein
VAFTVISHIATRLMGIEPDAPGRSVSTLGRLPADVVWVQLDHVPVGRNDLIIRHEDGNRSTIVANNAGPDITWEALFPGTHPVIQVDGAPMTAVAKSINGVPVSGVAITLKPGQRRVATVPKP